jgi:hypothetical protein|tara:strand:+ start:234 stop:425 length:192 start_codon:yes stop_codon:yes gene_type:complete
LITDAIISSIDEAKNNLKETLAAGSADTYADYKKMVGIVYGLDMAVGLINTAVHKYLKEEEED